MITIYFVCSWFKIQGLFIAFLIFVDYQIKLELENANEKFVNLNRHVRIIS